MARPLNARNDLRPTIFISYRRSDGSAAARQLADALTQRFGDENVFFDTQSIDLGSPWRAAIAARVAAADVVIAVIGPRWVTIADKRGRRSVVNPAEEDVLRYEIEVALRGSPMVVPVLVDDAPMPLREALPRPFKPLAGLEATELRHGSWNQDVETLIATLEEQLGGSEDSPEEPGATGEARLDGGPFSQQGVATGTQAPDPDHFTDVAAYLRDGSLVAVLGAGINAVGRTEPWEQTSGLLPDAEELARSLAERFSLALDNGDLARISQHISLTKGPAELNRALREILVGCDCEPGPVHRFLARIPARLREEGNDRYPLIVTTNYDTALERAFEEVYEPFDLAVFMATGEHKGSFFHLPWWDRSISVSGQPILPGPIKAPNGFVDFPIDEAGELARTVIVKIHGGVLYDAPPDFQLKHNFLITEDEFIGFLSRSPAESLVPVQILDKLRESHFLFLGYGVSDWSARVFLWRIWSEQKPGANSWAIQERLDKVATGFWEKLDVERYAIPLAPYISELENRLAASNRVPVEP